MHLPTSSALRARIVDLAGDALDIAGTVATEARSRAGDVADDAPARIKAARTVTAKVASRRAAQVSSSSKEAAKRARRSQVGEALGAGVGAVLPLLPELVRHRRGRAIAVRSARRAAPVVLRAHPVITLGSIAVSAGIAAYAARTWVQRRHADGAELVGRGEQSMSLDDDVARMRDEGGDPGGYDGTPRSLIDSSIRGTGPVRER